MFSFLEIFRVDGKEYQNYEDHEILWTNVVTIKSFGAIANGARYSTVRLNYLKGTYFLMTSQPHISFEIDLDGNVVTDKRRDELDQMVKTHHDHLEDLKEVKVRVISSGSSNGKQSMSTSPIVSEDMSADASSSDGVLIPKSDLIRVMYLEDSKGKQSKRSKQSKQRKQKKEKDPNAPKRPLKARELYFRDYRPRVVSEHPDAWHTEIQSKLGEMWVCCSAAEQQKYEQAAQVEMIKYQKVLAAYQAKKAANSTGNVE